MTCIVGMLHDGKVSIGADSAGVAGLDITIRKDPKVFKTGDFLIGCTSSFRMIELLQFSLKVKERGDKEIYEYMCTDFINGVRKCFKKGGYIQKFSAGDEKGGSFLVGYEGRLFKIGNDFQVGESSENYDSVGCGEDYAKGSLFESTSSRNVGTSFSTEDRITRALETAEKFSGGVQGPFIIKTI
jgi:hypothetical protein